MYVKDGIEIYQTATDISHDTILGEILTEAGVGVTGTFITNNAYNASESLVKSYAKMVRVAHDFMNDHAYYYFANLFCGNLFNGTSMHDIYKEMILLSSATEKKKLADKYADLYRDRVYKNAYAEAYVYGDVPNPEKDYYNAALNVYLDAQVEKYRQDLYRIEETNRRLIEELKERLKGIKSLQEEADEELGKFGK